MAGEPPRLGSQLSLLPCFPERGVVRARKEMGFHGRLGAAIKLAAFSETIRHFDAVIVCCMIYDSERKSLFMFFFC